MTVEAVVAVAAAAVVGYWCAARRTRMWRQIAVDAWKAHGELQRQHAFDQSVADNPPDPPQLAPAVERVKRRAGRKPRTVTADRRYGEKSVEDDLREAGVRHVVILRKGKRSTARQAQERTPSFRKTIKWRTGSEGRISSLKRGYGWDRTRLDGTEGASDLDRTGGPGPQPGQDRSPGRTSAVSRHPRA
jgi:IS5 family transposase